MSGDGQPTPAPVVRVPDAVSVAGIKRAWRGSVRQGLRAQALPDLHDHLDVHWRLDRVALRLQGEAVSFSYRPKEPEIARLEKAAGITRRLVVPAPADAIVLQAVVNAISWTVLDGAPTESAFFAASHRGTTKTMADVDDTFPSDWLGQWKEGQRRILEFTKTYPVIVVTDVANYFDAVPHSQLRNRISALGRFDEALVDLLFYTLESLTWRPEYLPRSGVGLPQISFDAPRLLAHAYMYEADRYLGDRTEFVRWMDDVTFGAVSVTDAKRTLRDLDELLSSLGVRLNAGKTKILTAKEGARYFRMADNQALTIVEGWFDHFPDLGVPTWQRRYARSLWRRIYRGSREGSWEKVIKRLFTVFRKSKDSYLQRWVPEILARYPALREPAFQYLRAIGYSRRRFQDVIDFVRSDDCLDDASLFGAARLVVDWALPLQGPSWREAVEISFELPAKTPGRAVGLCAAVWVLSKYGADEHLSQIVHQNEGLWRASEWASRLIAAATVRMNVIDAGRVTRTIASYGLTEGSAVLIHLQEIEDAESAAQRVRRYVQHDHSPHPYPIYKVLITLSIMRSRLLPEDRAEIGRRVIDIVADPWYKRVLARELMRIEQ